MPLMAHAARVAPARCSLVLPVRPWCGLAYCHEVHGRRQRRGGTNPRYSGNYWQQQQQQQSACSMRGCTTMRWWQQLERWQPLPLPLQCSCGTAVW